MIPIDRNVSPKAQIAEHLVGTDRNDDAEFSQFLADTRPPRIKQVNRNGVPVRQTSPFPSPKHAAWHALTLATGLSKRANVEYAGQIYARKTENGYTYGYTGPHNKGDNEGGGELKVLPGAPEGRIPSDTFLAGHYHTHGAYSVIDADGRIVATHDPARDGFCSDRFSKSDLEVQSWLAGRARANSDFTEHFGARALPELTFYLGTPSGDFRVHNPNEAADAYTAARAPRTGEPIGGTDMVLQRPSD